nr:TIGR00266 family protein [Humisphaera borealis]
MGGFRSAPGAPPLPPGAGRRADVIDYEIFGNEMQYVEVTLDPGEMALAEPGGMMFMEPGIVMQTVFGDPSAPQQQGFLGKLMTAGKRMVTGESLFMSTFTNQGHGRQKIAFAAPYPGKIIPIHLEQHQGELICQKDSFLAAARGVSIAIAFQKKIGVALFGGEGFIMQRLTGEGIALLHAGGTIMERVLQPGETLRVDTGCIVAMQRSVQYDIQFTGGFKNSLFGGEGLFLATVTGPGKVWLQSLPFARLAGRVLANASGRGKDEGSVLGNLGGFLGNSD